MGFYSKHSNYSGPSKYTERAPVQNFKPLCTTRYIDLSSHQTSRSLNRFLRTAAKMYVVSEMKIFEISANQNWLSSHVEFLNET